MIIFGVDPGVTTGAAVVHVAPSGAITLVGHFEIPGGAQGFLEWWDGRCALRAALDLIVCEDFILREGKHGVDITPKEVIGTLRAVASDAKIPVVFRAPSGRLKQAPDWLLKALGVHLPGKRNRNAREAVRHVIAHLKHEGNRAVMEAYRDRD